MERVVVVELQVFHQGQRSSGALYLTDRAVKGHHRRRRERKQLVVQSHDLRPVGLLDCRAIRMYGIDGRLELIRTGLVSAEASANDRLTLLDQGSIPPPSV